MTQTWDAERYEQALEWCRARQSEAMAYLRAGGENVEGAHAGARDAIMEEIIIMERAAADRAAGGDDEPIKESDRVGE